MFGDLMQILLIKELLCVVFFTIPFSAVLVTEGIYRPIWVFFDVPAMKLYPCKERGFLVLVQLILYLKYSPIDTTFRDKFRGNMLSILKHKLWLILVLM